MSDTRKGVFTPEQEQLLEKLYKGKGIMEAVDGVIIKTVDNVFIEKLKSKLPAEYLPTVYEIIDEIMDAISKTV